MPVRGGDDLLQPVVGEDQVVEAGERVGFRIVDDEDVPVFLRFRRMGERP